MPDSDRIKGKGKQLRGKAEKAAGDLSGNKRTKARGESHESEGIAQEAWGEVKDTGRDTRDAVTGKR